MKSIIKYLFPLCLLMLFEACSNDGLIISTVDELTAVTDMNLSSSNIVLSTDNDNDSVLLITWTNHPLQLNTDEYKLATNALTNTLQMDTSSSFVNSEEYILQDSAYFTGSALNTYAKKYNLPADVASTIYLRVKTTQSDNNPAVYSSVVSFELTPYGSEFDYIYMGLGQSVSSISDFSNRLCSPNKDGQYAGFFYAANGWQNFYLLPQANTDGDAYGSEPVNDTGRFNLYSASDKWSLWLDENVGLYYITADMNALTWSFVYMSSLNVYGDFNSWDNSSDPMLWDSVSKTYSATITFSEANSSFKLVTHDSSGSPLWSYQLGSNSFSGELSLNGDNITNDQTGTFVLTVDLSDPAKLSYTLTPTN
ncbi:MAG: DUF5111 domain-containing protein [Paludibacter sp.]|nr:DUF5111 domain-containing protein [Paludibacter sp.]